MFPSKYLYEYKCNYGLYLVHTLTFQKVVLDKDDAKKWQKSDYISMSNNTKELLLNANILMKSPHTDLTIYQQAIKRFGFKKKIVPSFVLYLTMQCNLKCEYCFQEDERLTSSNDISDEMFSSMLSSIDKINKIAGREKASQVTLFGGEPFLPKNKNLLRNSLEKVKKANGLKCEIISNAFFIPKMFDIVKEFENVIASFRFTIAGHERLNDRKKGNFKGSYSQIIESINLILTQTKSIVINVSLAMDSEILSEFDKLASDLEQNNLINNDRVNLQFSRIQFLSNPLNHGYKSELKNEEFIPSLMKLQERHSWIKDIQIDGGEFSHFGKIYRAWKNKTFILPNISGCRATTGERYCFYPDGYIYPCTEVAGNKKHAIAKFHPEFELNSSFMEWFNYSPLRLGKCSSCRYIGMCNGGCPATNISLNDDINELYCLEVEKSFDKFMEHFVTKDFQ